MFGLHFFIKSKNLVTSYTVFSSNPKLMFSPSNTCNFLDSFINPFSLPNSLIGQLLMFRCVISVFMFSRQTLIIWTDFAVMKLSDMSNFFTFEQNEVNTPTFDMKQSSSILQSDKFISIYPFDVWMSLTHWQISWKFCFVSLKWLKLITLSFSIFLNSLAKSLIYGDNSFDCWREKWVNSLCSAKSSQMILM